jgi:transcriptional regulator with XRE-family HTH domain
MTFFNAFILYCTPLNIFLINKLNKIMFLGEKLKSIRHRKGFSAEQIASEVGVDVSTYRRYERNETSPTLDRIASLAKALEVSIQELLPDNITQINNNQEGGIAVMFNSTINQLSEKLIEQYEIRINNLSKEIERLKQKN